MQEHEPDRADGSAVTVDVSNEVTYVPVQTWLTRCIAKSGFKRHDEMKVVYQKRLHCQRCIGISIVFNFPVPSECTMLNSASAGGENGHN